MHTHPPKKKGQMRVSGQVRQRDNPGAPGRDPSCPSTAPQPSPPLAASAGPRPGGVWRRRSLRVLCIRSSGKTTVTYSSTDRSSRQPGPQRETRSPASGEGSAPRNPLARPGDILHPLLNLPDLRRQPKARPSDGPRQVLPCF